MCAGWKPVDVGDDFLLGAEEGGFAGLEVLEDTSIIDPAMLNGELLRLAAGMRVCVSLW